MIYIYIQRGSIGLHILFRTRSHCKVIESAGWRDVGCGELPQDGRRGLRDAAHHLPVAVAHAREGVQHHGHVLKLYKAA